MARRSLRLGLALAMAGAFMASGCSPAPTASTGPASSPGTPTATVSSSPGVSAALADALSGAIDPAAILADLGRLQDIADEHGSTRQAGGDAEAAAAAYVADELRKAGLEVELQPVDVEHFVQDAPSILEIEAAGAGSAFEDLRDFKAMLFSASGEVAAQVFALGFDPQVQPGDRNGLGCLATDWAGVPRGMIVLLQPGGCRRHDVVVHAQAAGALAVVTSYADWQRDAVIRPTLVTSADIRIPVVGATHEVGLALAQAALDGVVVHLEVDTTVETRHSANVIAETPGGDPAHVVMLGGHLDSAVDGPGINDNGSGTMTVLEIARGLGALAADPSATAGQAWKVRVAFFTGEEVGLVGSSAYVGGLEGTELAAIEAYVNLDMLGSPNGLRAIYHGADTTRPIESGSLASLVASAFDRAGLAWEPISVGGSSDQFPFDRAGVPVGGLFSGANEHKTEEQAALFGGTALVPNDACFHLACDTVDNIDPVLLGEMARAAAWVVGALASGEVSLEGS